MNMPPLDPTLTLDELCQLTKEAFFWGMHPVGIYEMRYAYTQLQDSPTYVGIDRITGTVSRAPRGTRPSPRLTRRPSTALASST